MPRSNPHNKDRGKQQTETNNAQNNQTEESRQQIHHRLGLRVKERRKGTTEDSQQ